MKKFKHKRTWWIMSSDKPWTFQYAWKIKWKMERISQGMVEESWDREEVNKLPTTWKELMAIDWYYISTHSEIYESIDNYVGNWTRNIRATKEQAEASLAMSQLSQLMKVYNDWWTPDYEDSIIKYCIYYYDNSINYNNIISTNHFLIFETEKIRDLFLKNFRDLIEKAKPLL